ncbi:MAG: TetR/AcrR family transcriptional regulator [Azospirillaceae bacterium]|nr:TetR/AcrR family transcriptional regulator [Azospirillaceae bacterium]
MDNATRSERTRAAAIQSALAIIARDGPGRLTLDAIARESGISKGGLMHQFRTKQAVLEALVEHQMSHFDAVGRAFHQTLGPDQPEASLLTQIAVSREVAANNSPIAFAIIGALAEDPGLLAPSRESSALKLDAVREEAADPDLAVLRWAASMGLALTSLFGMNPLPAEEQRRLFDRLMDGRQWAPLGKGTSPAKGAA